MDLIRGHAPLQPVSEEHRFVTGVPWFDSLSVGTPVPTCWEAACEVEVRSTEHARNKKGALAGA